MLPMLVEWVLEHDAVAATVEYRLAPESPIPFRSRTASQDSNGSSRMPSSSGSTRGAC